MELIKLLLLIVHIGAGSIALLAAFVALVTAKGGPKHVLSGRVYAVGMTLIFLTALPLSIITENIFLLMIAFFSFYMVFAGWRFARNRLGQPHPMDWTAAAIMGLTGLVMWVYAGGIAMGWAPLVGSAHPLTLGLFGFIALGLSVADVAYFRAKRKTYPGRITRHLTNMLAGTIATITAVLVVNVDMNPVWVPWIAPTIVITPLIVWWNFRVNRPPERRTQDNSSA